MPKLEHAPGAWYADEGSEEHKELEARWPYEGLTQYRFYIDNGKRLFTQEGVDVAMAVGAFCLEAGRLEIPISKPLPMPRPWPFAHEFVSESPVELIQYIEAAPEEPLAEAA